jgi:Uma2 family endonuclease
MSTIQADPATIETVADLLERLGGIPAWRVRFRPAPGTATEQDVLAASREGKRVCELVDGVLVEKAMGYKESALAFLLGSALLAYTKPRKLGVVTGPDGTVRLFPGLVRIPDVAFASWDRLPGRRIPDEPIPDVAPDLAVEVLSQSNTEAEMGRKLREYFAAGVRLAWLVDPETRTVQVYTAPDQCSLLRENDTLDGGAVLPGFTLALAGLFATLDETG